MRQFMTAVLETFRELDASHTTEPYEAGWATEAMFFVRIHEASEPLAMKASAQISVDGLSWVDEGAVERQFATGMDTIVRVRHFGGWLRLALEVAPGNRSKASIWLVLKE
jgi:hypothetical protein